MTLPPIPWIRVLPAVLVLALAGHWVWGERADRLDEAAALREEAATLEAQLPAGRAAQANLPGFEERLRRVASAMPDTGDLQGLITTLASLAGAAGVEWRNARFGTVTASPIQVTAPPAAGGAGPTSAAATTVPASPAAGGAANPTTPTDGPVVRASQVDVDVAGTQQALLAYLDRIRELPRLLIVDKVSVVWDLDPVAGAATATPAVAPTTTTAPGSGPRLRALITLRAFTLDGLAPAAAGAAAPGPSTVATSTPPRS